MVVKQWDRLMWQSILKLLGLGSKSGPAPSLPSLPSASKPNSTKEPKPEEKKEKENPLDKLVAIARSQIGVKEVGGNNRGAKIREYQASTNLKPAAWPWCAAFTGWVIEQWLKDESVVKWLNLKNTTPAKWRPRTAAAFGYIQWAKSRPETTQILSPKAKPQVGDFAVFDFSHIGVIVGVNKDGFQCVEGNTNGRGDRDSTSGDGVWLKTRTASLVRNYIRINPSKK